jgi:hypothetical protein
MGAAIQFVECVRELGEGSTFVYTHRKDLRVQRSIKNFRKMFSLFSLGIFFVFHRLNWSELIGGDDARGSGMNQQENPSIHFPTD